MPKIIVDQFTSRPISRQRKYQLRQKEQQRCKICGERALDGRDLCTKHAAQARDIMRLHRFDGPAPRLTGKKAKILIVDDPIMDLI